MGAHGQRRRDLDAGQVGVPVVRGVGSGVPRRRAVDRGHRLRQVAARADAARDVPASERADAGVRVELLRRQPAGARVGDDLPAPHRAGAARPRRHRLPEAIVRQAARELHLVGQPQGSVRQERVRRRLPRPRQHRRLRPLGAAADRRAISSRRTARRGWRSSARTCWRSPSRSRPTTRRSRTWR